MTHVPFTGAGPAVLALLGGQIDAVASGPASVAQHIRAGKLRALAHWGDKPLVALPDVPSLHVVNGRATGVARLPLGEALLDDDGTVLVAHLGRAAAVELIAAGLTSGALPSSVRTATAASTTSLHAPWHLLDGLGAAITADIAALAARPDRSGYTLLADPHPSRMGSHPVLLHPTATIAPYVVFDASSGPIIVREKAVIRPFSVLCGPCAIGPQSTVADRSLIKANTTCGPQCRLGGEVGGTSIIGWSNKTHDGHLGDSIVGAWVNLGAGSDNSNLLNTYGEVPVRLEPDGPRQRSGRIFLGAIIGDHVKCAIGTRLMTGTVVGTGAMIASSTPPPSTVERFAWITDDGIRRYALPKFLEVLRTVFARRSLVPSQAYLERIASLHAASQRGTAERTGGG
jgi:UDP-N-acetylglucosamine diphosphorylase/glucosamine-1-phosphate N-acetyltransferase